jgi:hypothetical protein
MNLNALTAAEQTLANMRQILGETGRKGNTVFGSHGGFYF